MVAILIVINIMSDVENIFNGDAFFADTVDTPKEGVEELKKQERLKGAISKGKVHLLVSKNKWTHESVGKAINKTHGEYKQRKVNEKDES